MSRLTPWWSRTGITLALHASLSPAPIGPQNMTDQEFADRIRSMIEHENLLRDQRLNWLIASQGFLIAALGFSWNKDGYFVMSLAAIGFLFCVSIGANLYCNTLAIRNLAKKWEERCHDDCGGLGVVALRSAEIRPTFLFPWLYPWNVLPISLAVFWMFVLCYKVWS